MFKVLQTFKYFLCALAHLEFYNGNRLKQLVNSLKSETKSIDIVNWKTFRGSDKKNIVFLIDDVKTYENALKLAVFIKNNFIVNIFGAGIDKSNEFINKHVNFFETCLYNGNIDFIIEEVKKIKPDYVITFGLSIDLGNYLKKYKIPNSIAFNKENMHIILGTNIKHITKWVTADYLDIYNRLVNLLLC